MNNQIEVDVVIISWAKDEALRQVTMDGIDSLINDDTDIHYHIYIVESNKEIFYEQKYKFLDDDTVTTIHPDVPFGYHRYLNIGRKAGKSPYVVLCNNDLTYEKGWADAIVRTMERFPKVESASPWCPQTQGNNKPHKSQVYPGYQVRKELAGWCIFQQRKIYDKLGELDERFEFWYCDNDYSMELQKHKIMHVLVPFSVVNHHDGHLGKTGNTAIDDSTRKEYTTGQSKVFNDKWYQLNSNSNCIGTS